MPRPYQAECQAEAVKLLNPTTPTLLHIATGGGKTFVANNIVAEWIDEKGGYALWITKDWWLLNQAAHELATHRPTMQDTLARLGGGRDIGHIARLPQAVTAQTRVLYTTLHTFKRRQDSGQLPRRKPTLIVWDECHWGYSAHTGNAFRAWARRRRIPMLGLTATPRSPSDFKLACSHTFEQLVADGHLADYDHERRPTGTPWSPERSTEHGDFTPASLRQLAKSRARNRLIVDEYRANAGRYGKTIVFACDIPHALTLARIFKNAGIDARPIHSQMSARDNEKVLCRFKTGEIDVVINVAKLTHGVDIPSIKTVFLCRPTTSPILFSQMVGRGARRIPGEKDRFHLVQFTDDPDRFIPVVTPPARRSTRTNRPWEHRFDPRGAPAWTGTEVPDPARDLWYVEGQTFGVEFELTTDHIADPWTLGPEGPESSQTEWFDKAKAILESLRRKLGTSKVCADSELRNEYHVGGYRRWKVEWDSSAGWEVVSPVLKGLDGFLELADACDALTDAAARLDLCVNHRTGTHVHFGWRDKPAWIAAAIRLTHLLEPILRTLVAPSRFAAYDPIADRYDTTAPNDYCLPVDKVYEIHDIHDHTTLQDLRDMADTYDARTATFNPTPLLDRRKRVEVRLCSGTTEARKLLPWISLWMRILWAASKGHHQLSRYDLAEPAANFPTLDIGDALQVLALPDEKPRFRASFIERLRQRQAEIFDRWRGYEELRPWLPKARHTRRSFVRPIQNIAASLHDFDLANRTGRFLDLDEEGKACALWCTLLGEGPVRRRDRTTIALCADRLRTQGWVDFRRLRRDGRVYEAIQETLDTATRRESANASGWFDIPHNGYVRAIVAVEAQKPSPAKAALEDSDWRDCVFRAISRSPSAKPMDRRDLGRIAFEAAQDIYGVQYDYYVDAVAAPIDEAIDSLVSDGYIAVDEQQGVVPLADYLAP